MLTGSLTPGPVRGGAATVARALRQLRRLSRSAANVQAWRLGSGLVLFAFVLLHFLNHALGHVSVEAMEAFQGVRRGLWRSWPGTVALYGAVAVHVSLAVWKLLQRRTWRLPPWEGAQLALGLCIPLLVAAHVVVTRGMSSRYGIDDTYTTELRLLWPEVALKQSLLLLIVWAHAMIGLHFWLRLKAWYRRIAGWLLVGAILVPTVALTGWIEAARRIELESFDEPPLPREVAGAARRLSEQIETGIWVAFGLILLAIVLLRLRGFLRRGPLIEYPAGKRVRTTPGATLLEASRAAGVPHASICGGRGRCTTCRVMVLDGQASLSPPNTVEAAALARIDAPPNVRLACQIRPSAPLKVVPVVPLTAALPPLRGDAWGVERRITIVFSDLRGFTTLAERLYPYDAVFLLNRYFEVMSEAIERHGGQVDKFLGDGIMSLFGVQPSRGAGSRDALLAARDMMTGLDRLNLEFDSQLAGALRMGIGIHMGPAVLGHVGRGPTSHLTALGDSVNIASRLEGLSKDFGAVLVVSDAALHSAGLSLVGAERHEVAIRGREEMLAVHVARGVELVEPVGETAA